MDTATDPIDTLFDVDLALRFLSNVSNDEYTQVILKMVRKEHRKAIMILNDMEYAPSKGE